MDEPQYHLSGVLRKKTELPDDFDGPLTVILQLLSKNKIDISDVSISQILEQFLAYLSEQKRMNMEIASEFVDMASYLMLIKTKMLLSYSEQQEAISEMELLLQSLVQKKREEALAEIRGAISFLEERNGPYFGGLTKQSEPLSPDRTYRYEHRKEDLIYAFQLMVERAATRLPISTTPFEKLVGREPYPIVDKARHLLSVLQAEGHTKLSILFSNCESRSEAVAAFLAVLELCRMNCVELSGESMNECEVKLISMPDNLEDLDG